MKKQQQTEERKMRQSTQTVLEHLTDVELGKSVKGADRRFMKLELHGIPGINADSH